MQSLSSRFNPLLLFLYAGKLRLNSLYLSILRARFRSPRSVWIPRRSIAVAAGLDGKWANGLPPELQVPVIYTGIMTSHSRDRFTKLAQA